VRTLVDIGDQQIKALDELARKEDKSRAALIRAAIDDFLSKHRAKLVADSFGLWGDRKTDGLAYQEEIRGEW
jgi:predicted transcriptional regulator